MLRVVFTVALVGLAPTLFAQEPPRFEVASIKPSPPDPPTPGTAGARITERQARFSWLSLKDYIGSAYNVRVYQIVGPDWLASARFEIAATIPEGGHLQDVAKMIAALLEERFHLKSHREKREFPVYALETAGGFTLQPMPSDAPDGGVYSVTSTSSPGGTTVDLGDGALLVIANNRIELRKATFGQVAATLERFMDRPVVDMTGRDGRFNIAVDLRPEDFQAAMIRSAVAAGIAMPASALRLLDTASLSAVPDALKMLGLTLRPVRAPMDVLVIDAIDRMPTEN